MVENITGANQTAKQRLIRAFSEIQGSAEEVQVWEKMIPFMKEEINGFHQVVVGMVLLKMAVQTMTDLRISLERNKPEAALHPEQMKQVLAEMISKYIDVCEFIRNDNPNVAGEG